MTATDRWKRIQELFDLLEALPADRQIVELECVEPDPDLRSEVRRLLQSMRDEEAAQQAALREIAEVHSPAQIGPDWTGDQPDLKLISLIGSGGAGTVFRGIRKVQGIEQEVAVKIYHAHRSDQADQDRFVREQRMLATLTDPGIVRFFDSGLTSDGRPYLVMELAEGEHITKHCDDRRLGIEARLRLLLLVCRAVASAHARLIVHLDLKPSNILVTPDGDIKLLDFGTARLIDHSRGSVITEQLTPHYSSPERLRGEPASVSSDVYSLGLILFELCSGGSPFPKQASIVGMAERAGGRTTATGPADAASAEAAELRGTTLEKLRKQLKGDLASICSKALAFRSEDRYMTVAELADDLRRYLGGEPVEAHAPSFAYRTSKFVRRYAGRLALAAMVTLGLSAAATYSWIQARNARIEAEHAEAARLFLQHIMVSAPKGSPGREVTLAEVFRHAQGSFGELQTTDSALASDIELMLGASLAPEDKSAGEAIQRALDIAKDGGNVAQQAAALAHLGYRNYLAGRPDEAWEQLRRAMDLWSRNRSEFSHIRAASFLGVAGKFMTLVRPFDPTPREPLAVCLSITSKPSRMPAFLRVHCLEPLGTSLLFGSQEYAKALPLLEESVALRRRTPAAGQLSESLQILGLNYRFLGRYREDEQVQRESYLLQAQATGQESLSAANRRAVWAASLANAGNSEEGLRQAQAALAVYRRQYPQRAALLLWTPLSAVMANACLIGRFNDCELYAREAIETLGPKPSSNDKRLTTARGYLGLALASLNDGRSSEARPLMEGALHVLRDENRNPPNRKAMEAALSKLP